MLQKGPNRQNHNQHFVSLVSLILTQHLSLYCTFQYIFTSNVLSSIGMRQSVVLTVLFSTYCENLQFILSFENPSMQQSGVLQVN